MPDSALILRRHGRGSNLFSCLLFNELEAFNPRDQLAFAFVRDHLTPSIKINMFEGEVFEQVALEYRHNLKKTRYTGPQLDPQISKPKRTKRAGPDLLYVNGSCCSKCLNYLLQMWGEWKWCSYDAVWKLWSSFIYLFIIKNIVYIYIGKKHYNL